MKLVSRTTAVIILAVTTLILGGSLAYGYIQYTHVQSTLAETKLALADERTRVEDLQEKVAQKDEQVEVHKQLLASLREQVNNNLYDFSQIRNMVTSATQNIEDLKKLEETDEELLAKYSKVYFLNEHYEPENLMNIPDTIVISDNTQRIKGEVYPFLTDMLNAMQNQGYTPRIVSAFRSFDYQSELKHQHQVIYGEDTANKFTADQGYSEHQLGTTVDLTNERLGKQFEEFDTTNEYQWMLNNAHRYGFTLSYPEDNAYYEFEPWHWRFVGVALATRLHDEDKHFYDLSQREINAYRLTMFD